MRVKHHFGISMGSCTCQGLEHQWRLAWPVALHGTTEIVYRSAIADQCGVVGAVAAWASVVGAGCLSGAVAA